MKLLKQLLEGDVYKGNKSALARALKITQPAVTQLEDGTNRASLDTLKGLAMLARRDYREFLDPPAYRIGAPTRYALRDSGSRNRSQAIELILKDSQGSWLSSELEKAADRAAKAFDEHEEPSTLRWLDAIRLHLKAPRRTERGTSERRGSRG